ncbi:MAG: hypothetical protein IT290_13295 [Deltaproteobacteria bacterium]|nr:hypothetical protein [Deltaproteobacteria bacterium]
MQLSFDRSQLTSFLHRSHMPHAFGTAEVTTGTDQAHVITYRDGDWFMHDRFFGGEPYGGSQVIFLNDRPIWILNYYGRVIAPEFNPRDVYTFLREALRVPSADEPYRGPREYRSGEFLYKNQVDGDIEEFRGKETILFQNREIYYAHYVGGLVDQRAQGEM